MEKTLLKSAILRRTINVSILRDYEGHIIVRKSEIIAGIQVHLFETYALDIPDAYIIQQNIINEIYQFQLN